MGVFGGGIRPGGVKALTELDAIPDTSVSRPADDDVATLSQPFGAELSLSQDWPDFDCRISTNTAGLTTAYLYDANKNLISDIDISSAAAGDVVTFSDVGLAGGNNYRILADGGGSNYDLGHLNGPSFPYQSGDGNLEIVEAIEGSNGGSSTGPIGNFVEFGNLS